jgi:hypothetical protein
MDPGSPAAIHLLTLVAVLLRGIRRARTHVHSSHSHGEMNLAVVLVTICLVFVVCHLLRVYLAIQVTNFMTFKNIFAAKLGKNWRFLLTTKLNYAKM